MATKVVRGDVTGGIGALVAAFNALKSQLMGASSSALTFKGTATLVAGTVTVSNQWLTPGSTIALSIATVGGTAGDLSAPSASRVNGAGTGSFVINSTSGTDTSTVNYEINYVPVHLDAFEIAASAANATDLPSSLALVKQLMVVHAGMIADVLSHAVADATNVLSYTTASVVDLPSVILAVNDLKAKFNAHLTQATVHNANDAVNTVATANATDLPSTQALANAIKTAINAHVAFTAPSMAASLRLANV